MKSPDVPILKNFGTTEGTVRGTALVSRAVPLACYTLLSGFGVNVFLVAGAVQMTINGILEIPTGLLADRFGVHRSLLLSFFLKLFVTDKYRRCIWNLHLWHINWSYCVFRNREVYTPTVLCFLVLFCSLMALIIVNTQIKRSNN